jgi:hypothetical protein
MGLPSLWNLDPSQIHLPLIDVFFLCKFIKWGGVSTFKFRAGNNPAASTEIPEPESPQR